MSEDTPPFLEQVLSEPSGDYQKTILPIRELQSLTDRMEQFERAVKKRIRGDPSGHPHLTLELFLHYINEHFIKNNKDCMILVTGPKGSGKSSLALRALQIWRRNISDEHKFLSLKYLKKHMVFTADPAEIKLLIRNTEKGNFLFFDEATRFLLNEDWNTRESKSLKKIFAEVRPRNLVYMFNCPFRIRYIDKKYVSDLFEFWIVIFGWDRAAVFRRNLNPAEEGYDITQFEKLGYIHAEMSLKDWNRLKRKLAKMPNFFCFLRWGKIGESVYNKYEALRNEHVFKVNNEIRTSSAVRKKPLL